MIKPLWLGVAESGTQILVSRLPSQCCPPCHLRGVQRWKRNLPVASSAGRAKTSGPPPPPTHHSVNGNDTEANWHPTCRKGFLKGCLTVTSVAHHWRVQLLGWKGLEIPVWGRQTPETPLLCSSWILRPSPASGGLPRALLGQKTKGRNHAGRMCSCLLSTEQPEGEGGSAQDPQEGICFMNVNLPHPLRAGQDFGSLACGMQSR